MRRKFINLTLIALMSSACVGTIAQLATAQEAPTVPIYTDVPGEGEPDKRSDIERMFQPFGFMPQERTTQVSVNHSKLVDPNDPSKGTCIEYAFQFKQFDDWVGSYTLIDGTCWGTKPGINVQELLGARDNEPIVLRLAARGEGLVTFKVGGVATGKFASSLRFPVQPERSPTELTDTFQEITIGPIPARQLRNIVDPLCVVTTGLDNMRSRKIVRVEVDRVRFESLRPAARPAPLPTGWREPLTRTLFVTYTPTGFDPSVQPVKRPTQDDIRADLAAIREQAIGAGVPDDAIGVITYGCNDGLEQIPKLAHDLGLKVILGVFDPRNDAEVGNAEKLLGQDELSRTIIACCVGNEAITFRRATLEEIQAAGRRLRRVRAIPITTTEIIQSYGDERMIKSFDFTLVNAHALFASVYQPEAGAEWALEQLRALIAAAPKEHPIVVKELGWPSGPKPVFDPEQQATYWKTVFADPITRRVNVAIFDGLANVPWKQEQIRVPGHDPVNVGPHWPVLFGPDRKPSPFAKELLGLWKASRGS
jgi:exo-beta-1,3-glucanase (GH17 family)